MTEFYEKLIEPVPGHCLYAVIDKTSSSIGDQIEGQYAGVISMSNTSKEHQITDIGSIVFPEFRRTHVAKNALGLLIIYILDPPSAGGLGLRRVGWKCHQDNEASRGIASRMGFEFEGITRWSDVFPRSTTGLPVKALEERNGTKGEAPGQHTATYSIVWDEWDQKRPGVVAQMERRRVAS